MSDIIHIVPFLLKANRAGYANDAPQITKFADGAREIIYEEGQYRSNDYWWGGNPFAGQESIAFGGKVLWAMQYRGWMEAGFESMSSETFTFLRHALKECSDEAPLRGPKEFREDSWLYANSWGANLDNFHGEEKIWKGEQHVYTCKFLGGVVDV